MNIHDRLTRTSIRQLVETKEGRAFLLNQMADAEGGEAGELAVFDRLLAFVDDEKIQKIIRIHKDDELRHEELFRERARAQGVTVPAVPRDNKLLLRIDAEIGLFSDQKVESVDDIVRAYLVLLVIEERAMSQFALFAEAFAEVGDHETARVLREVEKDEERHLKYCHAVLRQYLPDVDARNARLTEMRALEARIFLDNGTANMKLSVARGYIQSAIARAFWRFVFFVREHKQIVPPTAYDVLVAQGVAMPA
jgi:hypothetical protein